MAVHEHTVVWQWARDTVAQPNLFGDVIKALRKRRDMPHRFPNKRHMWEYLSTKASLSGTTPVIDQLWRSYVDYNHRASRSINLDDLTPEQLAAALSRTRASA